MFGVLFWLARVNAAIECAYHKSQDNPGFVLQGSTAFSHIGAVHTADLNGDGISDALVRDKNGNIFVVLGSSNLIDLNSNTVIINNVSNGSNGFILQSQDMRGGFSSGVADVNGDGISDLIIGSPFESPSGKKHAGRTYVIFGSKVWGAYLNLTSLMDGQRGFVLQGEAAEDFSGTSVHGAGDVNGDGISDLIIGAARGGRNQAGKSYVVFGSRLKRAWEAGVLDLAALMKDQRGFELQGERRNDAFGESAVGVDLNGDSLTDMVFGAPFAGPNREGTTYVVFGSDKNTWTSSKVADLMDGHRGFAMHGVSGDDWSGATLDTTDFNGDQIADLVVGAPRADVDDQQRAGQIYIIFGSCNRSAWKSGILKIGSLLDGERGFVLRGERANDQSGMALSNEGDINGDGVSDLGIGAPFAGFTHAGKSYIVFGSRNASLWASGKLELGQLVEKRAGAVLEGEAVGDLFGSSIAIADLNGDKRLDLVIGAPKGGTPEQAEAGKAYVLFGPVCSLQITSVAPSSGLFHVFLLTCLSSWAI